MLVGHPLHNMPEVRWPVLYRSEGIVPSARLRGEPDDRRPRATNGAKRAIGGNGPHPPNVGVRFQELPKLNRRGTAGHPTHWDLRGNGAGEVLVVWRTIFVGVESHLDANQDGSHGAFDRAVADRKRGPCANRRVSRSDRLGCRETV